MKLIGVNWVRHQWENPRKGGATSYNVGDANCSPLQYFDFPDPDPVLLDLGDPMKGLAPDAVIFGGASWPRRLRRRARRFPDAVRIAWGVGWTERGDLRPMAADIHARLARRFHLYGHRDWGCDGEYVPCVSAMSPLFDDVPAPEHGVVFFGHAYDCPMEGVAPYMENDGTDMAEAVRFLASGETVVTGSYHGAYWATLLGRKVVAIPYSAKFWHLKYPPVLTDDWSEGVKRTRSYDGVLEECREINRRFHTRVLEVLS